MQASSQRTGQVRLALMLIVGMAAAAACVLTFMWLKAPVASAQEEGPTGELRRKVRMEPPKTSRSDRRPRPPADKPSPHIHDFYGNTTTDANSTLESLRAGGTTCNKPKDTAAYWIPTVSWTDSSGTTPPITANQTFFYYKLGGKSAKIGVNPQPPGLKIITVQGKNVEWRCQNGNWSTSPPRQCSNGKLVVRIKFPDCLAVDSSGQPLLDTDPNDPNAIQHRSHMVDSVQSQDGGVQKCPSTHPYPVPMLQTNFQYPIPTTRGTVKLSSDHAGDRPGSTMHADFFNAWQPLQQPPPTPPAVDGTLEDLVARCINGGPFTSSNPKPVDCGA